MLLVLLTIILGLVSVLISWKEIREKTGFFHFNILWILSGITGVFLSHGPVPFLFFLGVDACPHVFPDQHLGARKPHLCILQILYLHPGQRIAYVLINSGSLLYPWQATPEPTHSITCNFWVPLFHHPVAFLLMLGFLAAFLVKLPVVPLHNWLPDAHTEAPTAGSVILAGLLLKTGAYGLIRFVLPLFPGASVRVCTGGYDIGSDRDTLWGKTCICSD